MIQLTLAVLGTALLALPAAAHESHTGADSLAAAAMTAVVVDYHARIADGDTTALRHLAPTYMQAEMWSTPDPTTWKPSGTTPDGLRQLLAAEDVEWMRQEREGNDVYRNDVEILHARVEGTGGLVLTRERGSYLDGTWDARNAWLMVRLDGTWKIGASMHELPEVLAVPEP
jgi:hypothetical protein